MVRRNHNGMKRNAEIGLFVKPLILADNIYKYILHGCFVVFLLETGRSSELDYFPLVHDRYPVAVFGFIHVMGRHEHGLPPVCYFVYYSPEIAA